MHLFLFLLFAFIALRVYTLKGFIFSFLQQKTAPLTIENNGAELIPNNMFKFKITVEIIDSNDVTLAQIPFTVDSGEALGSALTTAENFVRPLLSAVGVPAPAEKSVTI